MEIGIELLKEVLEEKESDLKDLQSDKKAYLEKLRGIEKQISEYCSSIEDLKICINKLGGIYE